MDWGASGRRDTYRFTAVDPFTLAEQSELECVGSKCSVTFGYYTDNKAQASITMAEESYRLAVGNLVRISHDVEMPDGTTASEVLGTFFIDSAEKVRDVAEPFRDCNCYSTMWRLSQSALMADHVFHAGDNCADGLTRLMEGAGCVVLMGEGVDSTKTHGVDGRFALASNRLECANEYAGWLGWQIGVDGYGRQVVSAYTPPSDKAPGYSFEDGANCVYLPAMRETFTGDTCNEVIAVWSREKDPGDGLGTSQRAYSALPSGNPQSYEQSGIRRTGVLQLREPCTQAELQAKADEYLAQHDAAIRYIEIEHVGIPNLRAGDTVLFTCKRTGDENLLCEVTQMDIGSLGPLELTKSKLKVVGR